MAFRQKKFRLTFMKFHKTLLAFKMPKSGIYITKIDILNAEKRHLKGQKEHLKCLKFVGLIAEIGI